MFAVEIGQGDRRARVSSEQRARDASVQERADQMAVRESAAARLLQAAGLLDRPQSLAAESRTVI
jgi:hypothetical protein